MNHPEKMLESIPELHLENQFCFSLYSLSRRVTQKYTQLLKPLNITYPQYLVLLVLWQHREAGQCSINIGQLTQALNLDTGTVTPLLKRMEAKKLLTRARSTKDERIVVITLTKAAIALREQAKKIPQSLLCQSSVEPQEVFEMRDKLKQMLSLLA